MFGSFMRPNSRSCKKVNLNTIARQQKRKRDGRPSSKYRTISLDNFNLTRPHDMASMNNNNNNNTHNNNNNQHNPVMECEFKTTNLKTNKVRTLKKKVRLHDIRKVDDKLTVKPNYKVEYKCRSKDGKFQHSFSRMNVKHGSHSNSQRKPLRQKHIKKSRKLSTLYNKSMMTEDDYDDENFNVNEIKPVIMINNDSDSSSRLFSKPKKRKSTKGKKKTSSSPKKKPTTQGKEKGKGKSKGKKGSSTKGKKETKLKKRDRNSSRKLTKKELNKVKKVASK